MYALIATTHEWLDSPGCSDDHEHSWCDQDSYALSVTPVSLHRARRNFPTTGYEAVNADSVTYDCADVAIGDTAYVVTVAYTDGGTFGYSGYWCVAGVYSTPEAAEACRKRCHGDNDTSSAYRPWDGYFASLRDCDVTPLVVLA
jgi:hypothetical protein